jgi:hypothetical protein
MRARAGLSGWFKDDRSPARQIRFKSLRDSALAAWRDFRDLFAMV